jgi:prepilin signal peptidase PulO-like enzyme (type II secretory pathway)
MKSCTAAPGALRGAGADPWLRSGGTATQDEAACALGLLRRPLSAGGVFALALTFSVVAFLRFGWTPRLWCLVPLLIALAVIIVLDFRTKIIPDVLTLPGLVYALVVAAFGESPSLGQAVLGAVAGGGIVFLITVVSRGAVGGGDIKLMAMLGAALGWKGALAVLAFSQLAAGLVALGLLITRRASRRDVLPVGAIISLLGAVMLLGGR